MKNIRSTLATVWRIAAPYFRSEDKWAGRGLLAAVIVIELAIVYLTVLQNQWNLRFYNALQEYNWDTFVYEIIYFSVLATVYTVIAVYQLYLNQWLQIRWRRWMTAQYLSEWLNQANHYRMQLQGDAADNPDQRMTDDVKLFVDRTLNIGLGLLNSIVTLVSFVGILWGLSNAAPLHLFGQEYAIPGYLVWGALIYSLLGTVLTHLIGWPLVGIDYKQQQYEADFRFNLVRVRENSEQIALLRGDPAERERLLVRFGRVVENWLAIMSRTKKLTAFTQSYSQASVIFPYILVAPAYFAKKIQLGGMMQTASAFSSVQGALSFFISIYRQLAEWQAVVNRLDGFEAGIAAARDLATRDDRVHVVETAGTGAIDLKGLALRLPNGTPLVNADGFQLAQGRAHAGHRPVRLRQIHAVPRHRRDLAVRRRLDRRAGGGDLDDAAAAAVLPDRIAARGGRISGQGGDVHRQPDQQCDRIGGITQARVATWRRRALESHTLARRTAAPRARACAVARAELPVPRRGDRLARRTLRGRVVPPARGEIAANHDRLDRPPLDAGRLPSAQCQPGARWRTLRATG